MKSLKNNKQLMFILLIVFNIVLTVVSFIITLRFSANLYPIEQHISNISVVVYIITSAIFLICLFSFNIVSIQRKAKRDLFLEMVKANTIAVTALAAISLATHGIYYSVLFTILFTVNNLWILFLLNYYLPKLFTRILFGGFHFKNIVLVGGRELESFIDGITENHKYIYNILFIVTSSSHITDKYSERFKIYHSHSNIKNLIENDVVDEIIAFDDILSIEAVENLADCCYEENIKLYVNTSESDQLYKHNKTVESINNTSFYVIRNPKKDTSSIVGNIYEIIVTSLLLFLLSPLMLIISLVLWFAYRQPAIIKQKSVGLHGREFYCYKYRVHKNANTKTSLTGKFLLKTQIYKLPQLFNVIKGDMSLIGPEPAIISDFESKINWLKKKNDDFDIKPGLANLQKVHI